MVVMGWKFMMWVMGNFSFYLMGFGVGLNFIFIMGFYCGLVLFLGFDWFISFYGVIWWGY